MGGFLLLAGFLICGAALMDGLFPRQNRLIRLWLGACAGLGLMMWLPALFAFFIDFTALAQYLGLFVALAAAAVSQYFSRKSPRSREWTDMPLWLPAALILPLTVLSGYLQYTHILREVGGTLHVGQSTYGDLCLHLGIATSLRGASFPPDYSLLPGTLLGYPFLGDSMVASMLLLGAPLAGAFIVTGTLMMALVYTGFVLFAWELTHSRMATALAFLLMFINGGLGFVYALDGVGRDASAFHEIFTGFYRTPTNQPDLNLRWVNVICDMMIPQRTLLTGWMLLQPALWLLTRAIRDRRASTFAILGVWAGAMPMVHTHSFLGLGMISLAAMIRETVRAPRDARAGTLTRFLLYGGIAVLLALPQLFTWTFPQTVGGGSLRFQFNWVNNLGDGRLIDGYCWFWIKNVGIIWLMMVPAALMTGDEDAKARRTLACGAALIYAVAELILFQPNTYDNNKLFYVAYMAMMPAIGAYLTLLWKRLRGVPGRALLAGAFLLVSTLSGALSLGREIVSDYQLFGRGEVQAAAFIEENLPTDAAFLTGSQHNNAVAALTGRDIVCGTGSYLYFHGLDYSRQAQDERLMFEAPAENAALFETYGIDYVYLSSYERNDFDVDMDWFYANTQRVFGAEDVEIRALSESAKSLAAR